VSLSRLRDPERFAGWLASTVLNVYCYLTRRAPLTIKLVPAIGGIQRRISSADFGSLR
jgi:hypothetical protein